MRALFLTVALMTGCAARPTIVATPETKAEAVSLYLSGANAAELGEHFGIKREEARELIRVTLGDLYRKYYRDH